VGGLLVTAELSRPLLGRPSRSGVTVGDVLRVVQTTLKLDASAAAGDS
jgi:hypothetical protein